MRFLPHDEGDDDLHRHHQDYMAVSEPVLTAKKGFSDREQRQKEDEPEYQGKK